MRHAGEFINEGDTSVSACGKRILRVSGDYIQLLEVEALSSMSNDHFSFC
jgi:hypothetical protein